MEKKKFSKLQIRPESEESKKRKKIINQYIDDKNFSGLMSLFKELISKNRKKTDSFKDMKEEEINNFVEILSREIIYDYRRKDQLLNATYPEYLMNNGDFQDEIILNNEDEFNDFLSNHIEMFNVDKYMTNPFPEVTSTDNYEIQKNGYILPYIWQKILRKDFRYNVDNPDEWKLYSKEKDHKRIDECFETSNWEKLSHLIEKNVFILDFGVNPEVAGFKLDKITDNIFFFYFENNYYPIFFDKKYFFKTDELSPEAKLFFFSKPQEHL